MNLFACNSGSIHNDYLFDFFMIIALSILKSSTGNDLAFHDLISTSFDKIFFKLNIFEQEINFSSNNDFQILIAFFLYSEVNTPS
jgi:hypothetical protein